MTKQARIKMLKSNLNSSLKKLRQGLISQEYYNTLAKDAHKRIKELKNK